MFTQSDLYTGGRGKTQRRRLSALFRILAECEARYDEEG